MKEGEITMNSASKLGKRTSGNSSSSSIKRKKKPSPRSPLKDLNSTCINPRRFNEVPTRGCFSFFTSNSSSSSSSRSQLKTPGSAPHNSKNPSKPSSDDSKFKGPRTERNRRRPISKDPIFGSGYVSKGKNDDPNLRFDVDFRQNGCLDPDADHEMGLHSCPSWKESVLGTGPCLNSTSEGKIVGFGHESDSRLQCKGSEKNLSSTPNSITTPPIEASISPEIVCGSHLNPTPACFAAGHVVTGVHDRRKCRPRGVLTVGEKCNFSDHSQKISFVPPVTEASIRWHHLPSQKASGFWSFSPNSCNASRSPKLGELLGLSSPDFESTPSWGNEIRRTPTSNSSISPFSAMVQRGTPMSTGFKALRLQEERRGYRYDSVRESTPFNLNSMEEAFESMALSPKKYACNLSPPLPALSFQFDRLATPSSSTDLTCFRKNLAAKTYTDEDLHCSDLRRISWRDGLVSRIFQMGELGCCQGLSDDDDDDDDREETVESKFDLRNKSLTLKDEKDKHRPCGSASFEFPSVGIDIHESEAKVLPREFNSRAESFSTDGGLISSGDSDWTLSYKNCLFEV